MIAEPEPGLGGKLGAGIESAMREVTALDGDEGREMRPLSMLLARTESVASSRIEHIEAGLDEYARAPHGVRGNSSAVSMVAATVALDTLLAAAAEARGSATRLRE